MKRNDQERIERELKRVEKRKKVSERREGGKLDGNDGSVGGYIRTLRSLLQHDDHMIFNTLNDEDVLELLYEMKDDLPQKEWDTVIRKAVSATKVKEKELAVTELRSLLE